MSEANKDMYSRYVVQPRQLWPEGRIRRRKHQALAIVGWHEQPLAGADNSPETFDPADSSGQVQVLYKTNDASDIVIPSGGQLLLRVFLWHANGGFWSRRQAIRSHRLQAVTGQLQGIAESKVERQIVGSNSDLSVPGICLAKAHLFGTVDNNWGSSTSDGQIILDAHSVDPGKLVAAVHEFRIDGTTGNKVQVRVVVTDTEGSVGDGSETPAQADAHIRGSWPYTEVLCASGRELDHPCVGGNARLSNRLRRSG